MNQTYPTGYPSQAYPPETQAGYQSQTYAAQSQPQSQQTIPGQSAYQGQQAASYQQGYDPQFQQSSPQPQPQLQSQPQPRMHEAYQQPAQQAQSAQQQIPVGSGPAAQVGPAVQTAYGQAQQLVYPPVEQKKSRGWIVAIVIVVSLLIFSLFCVKSCTDMFAGLGALDYSVEVPAGDVVAVIDIDGTIQYDGSACSPEGLKILLDEAAEDDSIKAVVLRVNSGGGTATAGEEMSEYVRDFEKPVVVSSASINASAAYEISSQADYIYVAKSTEIGSIGTVFELTDISGLLEMLGVNMDVISSADSKDSSYGYRPLSEEERAYYQDMVDQINEIFIENVAEGRDMPIEEVRTLATGLTFTGITAIENGLADEIGTREDAIEKAAELAGISDYTTYDLGFTNYDLSSLYYLLGSAADELQNSSVGSDGQDNLSGRVARIAHVLAH